MIASSNLCQMPPTSALSIGTEFANLLLEKQAAGVQVNVIYDSVGCIDTPKEFFERLRGAGIQTLEFNPVNPAKGNRKEWALNNRDHRKLLIVDGKTAFLGGINIKSGTEPPPRKAGVMLAVAVASPAEREAAIEIHGAHAQSVEEAEGALQNGDWIDFAPPRVIR